VKTVFGTNDKYKVEKMPPDNFDRLVCVTEEAPNIPDAQLVNSREDVLHDMPLSRGEPIFKAAALEEIVLL
jgi:hypothetical protein